MRTIIHSGTVLDPANNVDGVKTAFDLDAGDLSVGPNGKYLFTTGRNATTSIPIEPTGFLDVDGANTTAVGGQFITIFSAVP